MVAGWGVGLMIARDGWAAGRPIMPPMAGFGVIVGGLVIGGGQGLGEKGAIGKKGMLFPIRNCPDDCVCPVEVCNLRQLSVHSLCPEPRDIG